MIQKNTVIEAKKAFNKSIEQILHNQYKFASHATYIKRLVKQYKLYTLVNVEEVFNEAYYRAIKYIEKTENRIIIPDAFMKRASLNIIREKQRKQSKNKGIDANSYQDIIPDNEFIDNLFSEGFSKAQIQSLKDGLLNLKENKPQDFQIIMYSVIEGKSNKKIVELLSSEGNKLTNVALRKRKSRIISALRKEVAG